MIMIVMSAAPLLAPFVGGYVLAWFGWRPIFWILAAFGAICIAAVALRLPAAFDPAFALVLGLVLPVWVFPLFFLAAMRAILALSSSGRCRPSADRCPW